MALFKCKMCGGALEINNNETVATCEYCGTQQTLPKLDDDRRANLYDRANHFRRNNEFDKAMGIYEQILNEDNADSEAYWSLVLCKYGIEYVEENGKRVPTVNRAQFTSVLADEDYKSAIQYADVIQKGIYEAEAKAIDGIQKGILEISQKEEPFDVFICYKESDNNGRRTPDSVLATELYHELTKEGFKVFFSRITLEDKLGTAYEPYIFAALNSSKVMVALGTKPEYFNAVWVKNEWSRYLSLIKNGAKKMLIPAYRDMDPYDLPEEFSHLQAQDMSKLGFMQDLVRGITKIVSVEKTQTETVVKQTIVAEGSANTAPLLKRAFMFLEDGDFARADEFCEQVLNIDPECAEAYLGKLMAELKVRKKEELKDRKNPFEERNNCQKAMRFGDETVTGFIKDCTKYINERNENERKAKRNKKITIIATVLMCAIIAFIFVLNTVIIPNNKYNDAIALMDAGNLDEAYSIFIELGDYKDAADKVGAIQLQKTKEQLKNIEVGSYITFGAYEQDNNTSNGKEDVEWLVLEVKDGKALVISKYALDCQQYNTSYTDVTWETCTLRKWLNDNFVNSVFTAVEKAMIPTVTVSADKNPEESTNPGNATQDQVFLLSITEAYKYFSSDSARQCKPTSAVAGGAYGAGVYDSNGNCRRWWLRSPGYFQRNAACVYSDGGVGEYGSSVFDYFTAVRPALWIDLGLSEG